jgi:glycyl-tRNA synthetase
MGTNKLMEKIVSLAKRRGFIYPNSEIYGGLANTYDYGPLGVELKNNIKKLWWEKFVQERDDMVGIDAALIMNPKVWEASGHTGSGFADPLRECRSCHHRFKGDDLKDDKCPDCGGELTKEKNFNILMKTYIGPVENSSALAYLRGETAQGMFVNFKNVLDTTRKQLPFGIAQIGKAFRNEITPSNFIFRTREFEQMEIEYFVRAEEWEKWFEHWLKEMKEWIKMIGINNKKLNFNEISDEERAHYSKRTIDIEYEFPFGTKELYGLAYRTDFDLKNHEKFSGQNLKYKDSDTGEEFWPHVIEPSLGVDRSVLAILLDSYKEEKDRVVLKIIPKLAPYKAAIFPLLANKPELVKLARKIYDDLRKDFMIAWDDRGNIGKRYYSQDEIGTPFCITVDFESLENDDVTVRDRDTMKQQRLKIEDLSRFLSKRLSG